MQFVNDFFFKDSSAVAYREHACTMLSNALEEWKLQHTNEMSTKSGFVTNNLKIKVHARNGDPKPRLEIFIPSKIRRLTSRKNQRYITIPSIHKGDMHGGNEMFVQHAKQYVAEQCDGLGIKEIA